MSGALRFENHAQFESYSGGFKDHLMHGQGTLRLRGGNVYVGGFADDKRHGPGYLLDYATEHKTREEWVRGAKTANSVTQPSTKADLDEHLGQEGYYYGNQASPLKKARQPSTTSAWTRRGLATF